MPRQPYPSDLSDAQWRALEPLVPPPKPGGRPRGADVREVVDASLAVVAVELPHLGAAGHAQRGGHGAMRGGEDRSHQQHLRVGLHPRREQRREGAHDGDRRGQ